MSKRWEYRTVMPKMPFKETEFLNGLGQQGWEAWARERCPIDGGIIYFLKRRVKKVQAGQALNAGGRKQHGGQS